MAAAWMARTGIQTLVVERKSHPTEAGHADGLESRTIEILDSFGLGQKIWDRSNHTVDICLWVRGISAVTGGLSVVWMLISSVLTEPMCRRLHAKTKYLGQFKARMVAIPGIHPGPISNRNHLA